MKKHNVDMLSGSITKGLFALTIPIMIMNAFQSLVGIIDMSILGILVNDDAVGAVGVSSSLISLITGLIIGIASGANVVVAKHVACKNQESVERAVGTSMFFAVFVGILVSLFGVIFSKQLLISIKCSEKLLEKASLYFMLYFAGVPFLFLYNFSAAILRSIGNTKSPMIYMCIGGFLKIILNFISIKVFNTTVEGVGIATVFSWIFASLLCLRLLLKKNCKAPLKLKHFRFYIKELGNVLFIGVPLGLQSALYSFANVAITATVNAIGDTATKGMSIANQFDGLIYYIAMAPSFAVAPYVSQNMAVKNTYRANKSVKKAVLLTILLGAALGGLFAIFGRPLCSIMSKNPEVITYALQKMVLISPLYFLHGISETIGSSLRALEKPIMPTITTLIFMCGIRFPWVWFVYPLYPNLTFLYLIWPIGWISSIITLSIVYIIEFKKSKNKIEAELENQLNVINSAI